MKEYRLLSVEMLCAPGVLRWAIAHHWGRDKTKMENVLMAGWGLTRQCAKDLLSKRTTWREQKNEETGYADVVFEYEEGKAIAPMPHGVPA